MGNHRGLKPRVLRFLFSIEYLVQSHLSPQTHTRPLTHPHYDKGCNVNDYQWNQGSIANGLRVIIFSIEYLVRTHLFPQTQNRTLTPPHYDTRCDPSKGF